MSLLAIYKSTMVEVSLCIRRKSARIVFTRHQGSLTRLPAPQIQYTFVEHHQYSTNLPLIRIVHVHLLLWYKVTTAHDVREGKIARTQFIHNTRTKFDAVQTAESSISTTDVHDDVTVTNWIFNKRCVCGNITVRHCSFVHDNQSTSSYHPLKPLETNMSQTIVPLQQLFLCCCQVCIVIISDTQSCR